MNRPDAARGHLRGVRLTLCAVLAAVMTMALCACKRTEEKPATEPSASPPKAGITIESAEVYAEVVPSKVTALEISIAGAPKVGLQRQADGWHLLTPVADLADQRAVGFALSELRQLDWELKPLASSPSAWAGHGFDPTQAATIVVSEGPKARPALVLGRNKTAVVGAGKKLYRVHNVSYFTFARELRFWRDRTVTRFAGDAVTRLEITDHAGATIRLARRPPPAAPKGEASAAGSWTIESGGKVDLQRAETVYRRLLDLQAQDLSSISLAEAGLQRPRFRIAAHTADGITTLDIGADATVQVKGGVYVRVNDSSRVLVLGRSAANLLAAPLAAWR